MRGYFVVLLLGGAALAGCLGGEEPELDFRPVELVDGAFVLELPVHVVAVGFDGFQRAPILGKIKDPLPPIKWIRADVTGDLTPEPLQYKVNYMIHDAPDAFAEALFAHAAGASQPAEADAFLQNYDRKGAQRICTPAPDVPVVGELVPPAPCDPITVIDAARVEQWILEHRGEYGLDFGANGYTMFVLDSWTKGYLPKDEYHQYFIDDGTRDPSVRNLRAWGGNHDFVYLDVGAAPSAYDFRPWANYSRASADYLYYEDRPVWDYDLSEPVPPEEVTKAHAAYERTANAFYGNLAKNIDDAARILWARTPIYPFEYAEKYVLPVYVFVDPNAHTNPASPLSKLKPTDLERHTDAAGLLKAFQDLLWWAKVEMPIEFVYLPDGDEGVAAALDDAKHRYSDQSVDFGVLKKYFRDHWADYAPAVEGARVYPTFAFSLEFPSRGLFAYSDGDELGNSWGVFYNVADLALCLRPAKPACFTEELFADEESWWRLWNAIFVHELGHSFRLTHTHDTMGLDADGFTTYVVNWLWDSTASVMTYRHALPTFDRFDVDLLERAHAVTLALAVLRAGDAAPSEAAAKANEALRILQSGRYQEAFGLARDAYLLAKPSLPATAVPGVAGPSQVFTLDLPGSYEPAGEPPARPPSPVPRLPPALPSLEGITYVDFAVAVPPGARALQVEYREADAPSHARWSAVVVIMDAEGTPVTGLYNNAYDKVVYLDVERCGGGCFGRVYGLSGVNLRYDIVVTPFL